MFRHVFVGVDGRPAGRDAIALARLLVAPGARPTLVYVHEPTPLGVGSSAYREIVLEEAMRVLDEEHDAAGIDAELINVAGSSVGRALHSLAESDAADLLVVGSCHRGFAGRVLVGNDTRAALNGASCAVAVAPLGYALDRAGIATIGVGYDGSPESEAALALARDLAAQHHATLRVLNVAPIPTVPYAGFAAMAWGDILEPGLAEANERLSTLEGVEAEALVGVAGEELAAFGGRVDLLVVGSRGYGPLRRLILGNTSQYLTSHARCPLLVLPRAATTAQDPPASAERLEEPASAPS